jgi:hypothetical protein
MGASTDDIGPSEESGSSAGLRAITPEFSVTSRWTARFPAACCTWVSPDARSGPERTGRRAGAGDAGVFSVGAKVFMATPIACALYSPCAIRVWYCFKSAGGGHPTLLHHLPRYGLRWAARKVAVKVAFSM